ncbi:hypothetical protein Hamer_G031413 [Homarus americanus]|uniref:Uncharacterized protein n=1 Tax=Homarus americanus TaxID=6706 RepID=A0A8J5JUV6_HOMAM|nr:hypothetical protein Hamer_G031413 [Homarus americanus]
MFSAASLQSPSLLPPLSLPSEFQDQELVNCPLCPSYTPIKRNHEG